jgi:putative transposase
VDTWERESARLSLWRAPRIHGELLKLGIEVSERTVSRVLRTVERPPSQTWKTFLKSHVGEIVAIDFFTVPTIRLQVLFVFLVLEHQRRKVLHFGVTEHPSAEWAAQQVVEAFTERRLIGSIRHECLDHILVLNQRHLRKMLRTYLAYYHRSRTHLALEKDAPEPRAIISQSAIIAVPQVGGWHRR